MKYTDPEELKYLYSKPQQNYFAPGELRNIENFKEAHEDNYMGWCIHHRLEINPDGTPGKTVKTLLAENLYYMRPASELIFLRVSEHLKLHHTHTADAIGQASTRSLATKERISETMSARHNTDMRYSVVLRHIKMGDALCFKDYQFYRRYCVKNGVEPLKVTLDRKAQPLMTFNENTDMQKERYEKILHRLHIGRSIDAVDYQFLKRYCTRANLALPILRSALFYWEDD